MGPLGTCGSRKRFPDLSLSLVPFCAVGPGQPAKHLGLRNPQTQQERREMMYRVELFPMCGNCSKRLCSHLTRQGQRPGEARSLRRGFVWVLRPGSQVWEKSHWESAGPGQRGKLTCYTKDPNPQVRLEVGGRSTAEDPTGAAEATLGAGVAVKLHLGIWAVRTSAGWVAS